MSNKTRKNKNNNKKSTPKHNLEILFDKVLETSYKMRKANPKLDGQSFWQPIKKALEPLDEYTAKKWKDISKNKTKKVMLLSEYTIDGYGTKTIDENNHFIIQQVRIPLTEKPSIKKIIQVALNIGQYRGTNGGNFVYNIKFNNVSQFINKDDIIRLSAYLTYDIMDNIMTYLNLK